MAALLNDDNEEVESLLVRASAAIGTENWKEFDRYRAELKEMVCNMEVDYW